MEIHDKKQLAAICIERLKKEYPLSDCTLDYEHAWQLLVEVRLAAQCTDARVNVVVQDLFAKYPNVAALAAAEPEEIEEIVRPCGLGRSKARDISACMRMLRDKYDCNVPDDFDALLELPGVGRKSANLIMGDVFGKPAIVTDTHWRAVISATGWWTMAAPCAPHAPHRIVSAAACGMCAAMRMKKAKRTEPGNAPHHTTPFICLLFYKTLGFWLWGML